MKIFRKKLANFEALATFAVESHSKKVPRVGRETYQYVYTSTNKIQMPVDSLHLNGSHVKTRAAFANTMMAARALVNIPICRIRLKQLQ
jgi:hypothetical protein